MEPRTYLFVPGNRPERYAKALGTAELGDQGLELDKPRRRVVPRRDAGCPGQLLDRGVESATPVESRAVVAHARVLLGSQPLP